MLVNPRKVAPGWIFRWPKQAFLLMSRAWILWMGTAALLAVASQLLVGMGVLRLLFWPLGLFVMLLSTGFARLCDHKFVTGDDVLKNCQSSFRFLADDLKHRRFEMLAALAFYLLSDYLRPLFHHETIGLAASASSTDITCSNLFQWLLLPRSPLSDAGMAMFAGCLLATGGFLFPGMSGCLRQAFQVADRDVLLSLMDRAAVKNALPLGTLALCNGVLAFLSESIPVVGWALGVFMPLLSYVAFREIFVDDNGNRKRAPRAVSSSISNIVADAA